MTVGTVTICTNHTFRAMFGKQNRQETSKCFFRSWTSFGPRDARDVPTGCLGSATLNELGLAVGTGNGWLRPKTSDHPITSITRERELQQHGSTIADVFILLSTTLPVILLDLFSVRHRRRQFSANLYWWVTYRPNCYWLSFSG